MSNSWGWIGINTKSAAFAAAYECIGAFAWGVDNSKLCALLCGCVEHLRQSGNLTRNDGGGFVASAVTPIRSGRLWVEVDDGNGSASKRSGDG